MNAGIQGLAADIFKVALVRLDARARATAASASRLILQVHDEVLARGAARRARRAPPSSRSTLMRGAADLRVPLEVNLVVRAAPGPTPRADDAQPLARGARRRRPAVDSPLRTQRACDCSRLPLVVRRRESAVLRAAGVSTCRAERATRTRRSTSARHEPGAVRTAAVGAAVERSRRRRRADRMRPSASSRSPRRPTTAQRVPRASVAWRRSAERCRRGQPSGDRPRPRTIGAGRRRRGARTDPATGDAAAASLPGRRLRQPCDEASARRPIARRRLVAGPCAATLVASGPCASIGSSPACWAVARVHRPGRRPAAESSRGTRRRSSPSTTQRPPRPRARTVPPLEVGVAAPITGAVSSTDRGRPG